MNTLTRFLITWKFKDKKRYCNVYLQHTTLRVFELNIILLYAYLNLCYFILKYYNIWNSEAGFLIKLDSAKIQYRCRVCTFFLLFDCLIFNFGFPSVYGHASLKKLNREIYLRLTKVILLFLMIFTTKLMFLSHLGWILFDYMFVNKMCLKKKRKEKKEFYSIQLICQQQLYNTEIII